MKKSTARAIVDFVAEVGDTLNMMEANLTLRRDMGVRAWELVRNQPSLFKIIDESKMYSHFVRKDEQTDDDPIRAFERAIGKMLEEHDLQ